MAGWAGPPKAIKSPDKTHQAVFWRNLGIIHYSQRKYKQAARNSNTPMN
jgi:hypothetical protein